MARLAAEFFGTMSLLAVITGSGIMGESLSAGNPAVALLGNSLATGAGLYVLITVLAPISGAHFNPVVSFMFWKIKELDGRYLLPYFVSQIVGGVIGIWVTHLMFGLPIFQFSTKYRGSLGMFFSEFLSTLVLLSVIFLGSRSKKMCVACLVALAVMAGYWFTSSTFFVNPAVTIARAFTDTFVGIDPQQILPFIASQFAAAITVLVIINLSTKD